MSAWRVTSASFGVADGDGSVALPAFLHQHCSEGLAYDIATAHDNDALAASGYVVAAEQLYYAGRGCGVEAGETN